MMPEEAPQAIGKITFLKKKLISEAYQKLK